MRLPGRSALVLLLPAALYAAIPASPESWIPARWTGGPLEIALRTKASALPPDTAVRESIATWYDPATLNLIEGSPINCLVVTWSAGGDPDLEFRQQQLVKTYAAEAHRRNLAIVGLVYPGADPARLAAAAMEAHLDGLALDGEFPAAFADRVSRSLAQSHSSIAVIPTVTPVHAPDAPVLLVEGTSPTARNLSEMGIRAAPSSEPWIESNIWLVRSMRLASAPRAVWVGHQPEGGSPVEYSRAVADAAIAGGRWVVALDDALRAKLRRHDPAALAVWQGIGACLRFAGDHAEWRNYLPYGNLALVVDTGAADRQMADEYLKLVARRQVPYRLIARSQLTAASLAGLRAVLATELEPMTGDERKLLQAFAESGGLVVAGPSWGGAPKDQPYKETPLGKGRVAVYGDPDPESIAREMRELLSHRDAGIVAFNVPSVITYASTDGKRVLVQLLNYSNVPATDLTIRVAGNFKTARLIVPDAKPATLKMSSDDGKTDITIPKLSLWGGVLLD